MIPIAALLLLLGALWFLRSRVSHTSLRRPDNNPDDVEESETEEAEPKRSRVKEWMDKVPASLLTFVQNSWRVVLGLVVLHLVFAYLFPTLYVTLASQSIFWVNHLVVLVVFVFLRDTVGKNQRLTGFGKAIMILLVTGNLVLIIGYFWQMEQAKGIEKERVRIAKLVEVSPTAPPKGDKDVWSAWIPMSGVKNIQPQGPIWIRTAEGEKFPDDKGMKSPQLPRTDFVQFQSRNGESVPVIIDK